MTPSVPRVLEGSGLEARSEGVRERLVAWAPRGRIVEICAGPRAAQTSAAVDVLRAAQAEGDPVAWVWPRVEGDAGGVRGAGLFPPDLAAAGLDLAALVVVHVPGGDASAGARALELVLRTGAFGAAVLDLTGGLVPRGSAWQGRLLGLAREHACRVVVLSPQGASSPSLGPFVSLRVDPHRTRAGTFEIETRVLKDKAGIGWITSRRSRRGPDGLR